MVHTIQSHLLAGVPASQSIAAGQRARDLKAAGHDIVAVTVGEPDFATPPEVIEAAFAAARDGQTKYTPVSGTVGYARRSRGSSSRKTPSSMIRARRSWWEPAPSR